MKSVLTSIQPKWCELIVNGKKTVEVRKTRPKLETPFKCYIYCTKDERYKIAPFRFSDGWCIKHFDDNSHFAGGCTWNMKETLNGKVIGEFVCDRIDTIESEQLAQTHKGYEDRKAFYDSLAYTQFTCLTYDELSKYVGYGISKCYGWHISDLKIYDKPKELGEFRKPCPNGYRADTIAVACYAGAITCKYRNYKTRSCNAYISAAPQSWCYVEG